MISDKPSEGRAAILEIFDLLAAYGRQQLAADQTKPSPDPNQVGANSTEKQSCLIITTQL